jgi:hypothetical protein
MCIDEVGRRHGKIVIPLFKLLQDLKIDQIFPPQVLEEVEVRPTGAQDLAFIVMRDFDMFHSAVPCSPPILKCVLELVAQGTLDSSRRLLAAKVALAVPLPLFRIL